MVFAKGFVFKVFGEGWVPTRVRWPSNSVIWGFDSISAAVAFSAGSVIEIGDDDDDDDDDDDVELNPFTTTVSLKNDQ